MFVMVIEFLVGLVVAFVTTSALYIFGFKLFARWLNILSQ